MILEFIVIELLTLPIGFSERKMVGHICQRMGYPQILKSLIGFQSSLSPPRKKPFEVFWGWWVLIEGSYTCYGKNMSFNMNLA
jgi:hypothetical protein